MKKSPFLRLSLSLCLLACFFSVGTAFANVPSGTSDSRIENLFTGTKDTNMPPNTDGMRKVLAACLFLAAQTYSVPPAVLVGIYEVEGGQVGQEIGPKANGTYDLGPMKINSSVIQYLAKHWKVSEAMARRWIRDDPCTNFGTSSWLLRTYLNQKNDMAKAISLYGENRGFNGEQYKERVIAAMTAYGLIKKVDGR